SLLDNAGTFTGTDFTLVAGVGYQLYSDVAGSYTFSGTEPTTPASWTLLPSWDLVGLTMGITTPLSASVVLANLQAATGGVLNAVYALTNSQWTPSLIDDKGSVTGRDFVLQPGVGYLLYTDTAITFQPYSTY